MKQHQQMISERPISLSTEVDFQKLVLEPGIVRVMHESGVNVPWATRVGRLDFFAGGNMYSFSWKMMVLWLPGIISHEQARYHE